jgi:integrase/predicted DNA-binding transcriptional regulator AlpA
VTTRDVAGLLRCAPSTVLKYVSEGKLPRPVRIGGLTRWRRDKLLAFLEVRWGVVSEARDRQTPRAKPEPTVVSRPRKPKLELPAYVNHVRARGKDYFYYHPRRGTDGASRALRLPGTPQDPEFWKVYRRLHGEGELAGQPRTIGALIDAYLKSPEFERLAPKTREAYSSRLAKIGKVWGERLAEEIRPADVLKLRDDLAGDHSAPNETVASLSAMFSWSIPREWRDTNPCKGVPRVAKGDAFAPWPDDKIELLKAYAPRPIYWAAMVALYTGQRRGDVLRMMWSDIDQQGLILVRQGKTGKRLWVPLHSRLREILAEIPRNSTNILTSGLGKPWKEFGFSTAWQRTLGQEDLAAIREAGLVFHGLRKSAAVKLAEAGCTDAEIAAITGQTRQMVEHYTKGVDQKRLAVEAMRKWESRGRSE